VPSISTSWPQVSSDEVRASGYHVHLFVDSYPVAEAPHSSARARGDGEDVGPLPSDQVAWLLRSYRELANEQAEVKAQLVKLAPAWGELRKVLNELNRVLEL
jgi:hypothetical protein